MNIVYILNDLNRTAPNTVMVNLFAGLPVHKIKIIALYSSGQDNYIAFLKKHQIDVVEFDGLFHAIKHFFSLLDILKGYGVLHTNGYKPNILGYILKKINPSFTIVSTCHSVEKDEIEHLHFHGMKKIKNRIKLVIHGFLYQRFDCVIAVSHAVENYLRSIGCRHIPVVYNGIDYQQDLASHIKNTTHAPINICQVGHICSNKNQLYTLRLLGYLKNRGLDVKIHFFGDYGFQESYYHSVQKFVKESDLENEVVFYGNLQFKDLFEYLKQMDLFIMPSMSEGLPLALLEAFNFELAAIVSNRGGMKEIVKDGENGLVVDVKDDNDFSKIYTYIVSGKYIQDGINAKKTAMKKYSLEQMRKHYIGVYKQCINKKYLSI